MITNIWIPLKEGNFWSRLCTKSQCLWTVSRIFNDALSAAEVI